LADDNYYSAVAAAQLHDRAEPHPRSLPKDDRALAVLAGDAAFSRSAELFAVGLPAAAMREWRHAFDRLEPVDRNQSIHLAMQWRWYDLAVATATQQDIFFDYALLYPRPFANEIAAAAKATGLDANLLYAVMRQESLYRIDAESAAGARGLMQLRPGTAARFTARLEGSGLDHADLLDPAVNIRLGAEELARLLERYDGQLPVALAAYNAGPHAADRWLPDAPIDADVWIENIPYNETRDYVRRVLWHTVVFRWLDSGRGLDARPWLRVIEPLADDAA
jgi:soluble lytic murein transglycosylase